MKIHVAAQGFTLTPELDKYAGKKARFTVRKLPRAVRAGASCTIHFTQEVDTALCAMTLTVRDETFTAEEATLHPYAALDIVATSVEYQLADFIARHGSKYDWHLP